MYCPECKDYKKMEKVGQIDWEDWLDGIYRCPTCKGEFTEHQIEQGTPKKLEEKIIETTN